MDEMPKNKPSISEDVAKRARQRIVWVKLRFRIKRIIEKFVNRLLALFSRLVPATDNDDFKRILIIQRILRIGDTLVARPALAALRKKHPDAHITLLCAADLVELNQCDLGVYFDEIISANDDNKLLIEEVSAKNFDLAYVFVTDRVSLKIPYSAGIPNSIGFDYAGRGATLTQKRDMSGRANSPGFMYDVDEPEIHVSKIWLDVVSPSVSPPLSYPEISLPNRAMDAAYRFVEFNGLKANDFVVLHPFPAQSSYRWRMDRWRSIIERTGRRADFVITGGPCDKVEAIDIATGTNSVVAAGELSIIETMALIKLARLVISVDTATVHIASTVGTAVIGLYGPGDPDMWKPLGVPYRILFSECPCSVCKRAKCFQTEHYCMDGISVGDVLNVLEDIENLL